MTEAIHLLHLPEKSRKRIAELIEQRDRAKRDLVFYLEGIQDGLGLDDNWNLNTKTWTLEREDANGDQG